jgi:organic radical activating enzyme
MSDENQNSFLPIPSDTACLMKWSQVSLFLWENSSASCHRNTSVTIDDSFDFHNTEPVLKDRIKMLNGEWPNYNRGCEHCKFQELYGGTSDRQQWLQNPRNKKYVPKELYTDPRAIKVQPTQLSVHFNNKCNMKCVYCDPYLSSAWAKEIEMFDGKEFLNNAYNSDTNSKLYNSRLEKFWNWMENNYSKLKAFDILGGEPWIQRETWECVDWLIAHPNLDCDFEIYTNMQVKPELFKRNCERLKELSKTVNEVIVVTSIDCWGPASEYIRFGHDMSTFEENMNYLIEHCSDDLHISINSTITSLSIPYMPLLLEKVVQWNTILKNKKIDINYNKCMYPAFYDPSIMPGNVYEQHIETILSFNDKLFDNTHNKNFVKGLFNEIVQSPHSYDNINALKTELSKLDSRRGTNWKETFPWLVEINTNE